MIEKNKKENQKSKFKIQKSDHKGITLIALVITIIVLLILAGVTINIVLSEGGLFSRATEAQDNQKMAEVRDKASIILSDYQVDKYTKNKELVNYLNEKKTSNGIDDVTEEGNNVLLDMDDYIVTINKEILEIISIEKNTKSVRINLSKNTAELNEEITADVKLGEEMTLVGWAYTTDETLDTTGTFEEVTNTSKEITLSGFSKNEKGVYYLHLLVQNAEGVKSVKTAGPVKVGFVLITKIELKVETGEAVVEQGKTLNIIAEITPDNATEKKLDWTTSDEDEEIAEITIIDEENLTATIKGLKAGEVTIKAKATDGTDVEGQIKITVKAVPAEEFDRAASVGDIDVVFVDKQNNVIDVATQQNNLKPTLDTEGKMVPVYWDATSSAWIVCETTSPNWYSYTETDKRWANIMLRDGLEVEGITDTSLETGATIAEMAGKKVTLVGSMFVYIPRYAYKITYYDEDGTTILGYSDSTGITDTVGRIVDGTNKVNAISVDKSENERNYVVHPAFRNGNTGDENTSYKNGEWNEEISGIWVAKFEASFADSGTTAASGQYNGTDKTLQTKPGVASWRDISVNNIYTVCKNYTGISASRKSYDEK